MPYPRLVSRDEWLAARAKLLTKEKEATHARDKLNAERRRLPMVKMEKEYPFEGPNGKVRLLDLFDGRRQFEAGPCSVRREATRRKRNLKHASRIVGQSEAHRCTLWIDTTCSAGCYRL